MDCEKFGLSDLPCDLIDYILELDSISHQDLCRLSCVSKYFRDVAITNRTWWIKYAQRWPDIVASFDVEKTDWKSEFITRHKFRGILVKKIMRLSYFFYSEISDKKSEISFSEKVDEICKFHPQGRKILATELLNIVEENDGCYNLTHKYFAKRLLCYVRHRDMNAEWMLFLLQKPSHNSVLIEGVCFIARWFQIPDTSNLTDIRSVLTSLCERVFKEVKRTSPNHPLIATGMVSLDEVAENSLWSPRDCRTVLCCINYILFKEMGISVYNHCRNTDVFLDQVFAKRRGTSQIISIVYASIACRLGVNCTPVAFCSSSPEYFVKWHEHPNLIDNAAYTFIDVYNNGAIKSLRELQDNPGYRRFPKKVKDPMEILYDMSFRIVQLIDTFCCDNSLYSRIGSGVHTALCPLDLSMLFHKNLKHSFAKKNCKVQTRNDEETDVKYAVGMIMVHKRENYRCVINGWRRVKGAIRVAGHPSTKVLYNVLVDQAGDVWVPQDDLEMDFSGEPICHSELGKYFETFQWNHYLPNVHRRVEYPHEGEVRNRALIVGDL